MNLLQIYLEKINRNWKNEITEILKPILYDFSDTEDNFIEEIKEITNTRIILLYNLGMGYEKFEPNESEAELKFSDLEIAVRHSSKNDKDITVKIFIKEKNFIWQGSDISNQIFEREFPMNKAEEIIKIWKNRK